MDQGLDEIMDDHRCMNNRPEHGRRLRDVIVMGLMLMCVSAVALAFDNSPSVPVSDSLPATDAEASSRSGETSHASTDPADADDAPEPAVSTGSAGAAALSSAPPPKPASGGKSDSAELPDEQYVKVGVDNRITMHVANLPLSDAVRMLSEPTHRNIILAKGVTGSVSATLYNVTFEAALEAMLLSNGLGYRIEGNFIFVYPLEELEKFRQAERKTETRIFKLSYVKALTVKDLIEPMKSGSGKISVTPEANVGLGGDAGPSDTHGDALSGADMVIVTDFVDRLDAMAEVIKQVDVRPEQVLIEATILRATLNEDNALGVDFTTVGGIDFTELSSTSPAAQDITTGQTPAAKLQETTLTARTDFNGNVPSGGFTFGIIKDQIGVFVRALETITDTDIIANPKVLALNKQWGQVIVGRRDGYLTTTITETTAVQTVEFLETGTILAFRPYIGNDGFVRMEIHPKDSTGGLTAANLPFEQTTEVTTNIMVRDGNTILIGGLFREVATSNRSQVPGLGNIPGLGAIFRSTGDNTVREEVIILLTVHIVKPELDSKASDELNEDVERFRVGMRKGVQWFGRERLAQAHYTWALQHLARGDTNRALWDAELAYITFPKHVEALKLAEKLKNQRIWECEASAIRGYIRDRIMEERGEVKPPFGRPAPPYEIPHPADMESYGEIEVVEEPESSKRPEADDGQSLDAVVPDRVESQEGRP